MTKPIVFTLVLALCLLLASTAWAESLSVQTRETSLRAAPSFTSKLLATLSYGQQVDSLGQQGAWVQVKSADSSGWVHQSALTTRTLNLSSGGQASSARASEREVSMAGKGFNSSIEQEYRGQHPGGYAQVEAMLQKNYSPEQLYSFLAAGQLKPKEDGQ